MSGANSYTGATTVSQGTLSVNTIANGGVASAIGASTSASSNLVIQGATLQYTGASATSDRGFTIETNGPVADSTINVTQARLQPDLRRPRHQPGRRRPDQDRGGHADARRTAVNDYTGVTTVSGGTLAVSTLADGGSVSSIGASSSASSNLVLQGGGRAGIYGRHGRN